MDEGNILKRREKHLGITIWEKKYTYGRRLRRVEFIPGFSFNDMSVIAHRQLQPGAPCTGYLIMGGRAPMSLSEWGAGEERAG